MPHFQQALRNECRIFLPWQTSCPWNEVIHLQAFPPSTTPALNTTQGMAYHSAPVKGLSSPVLILLAGVNKSLETPFLHTRDDHNWSLFSYFICQIKDNSWAYRFSINPTGCWDALKQPVHKLSHKDEDVLISRQMNVSCWNQQGPNLPKLRH